MAAVTQHLGQAAEAAWCPMELLIEVTPDSLREEGRQCRPEAERGLKDAEYSLNVQQDRGRPGRQEGGQAVHWRSSRSLGYTSPDPHSAVSSNSIYPAEPRLSWLCNGNLVGGRAHRTHLSQTKRFLSREQLQPVAT